MPSKYSKISQIVQLHRMLRRWRIKSRKSTTRAPSDVPAGHVALCVGANCTRFVVRATYLNHPVFEKLLLEAEEEYGFSNNGPLTIPCDEALFQQLLRFVSRSKPNRVLNIKYDDEFYDNCHVAASNSLDSCLESRPLLRGAATHKIIL